MREGLEELERASAGRPDWDVAKRALAVALLRSGQGGRAGAEFEELIGSEDARALASGRQSVGDLAVHPDAEDLLGLGVAYQQVGRYREADRLLRAAADVWGPSALESARAYELLSQMLEEAEAPWGDAAAESAKAVAIDRDIAERDVLPKFPDPSRIAGLAPYLWPVRAVAGEDSSRAAPRTLPALARWPVPEATPSDSGPEGGASAADLDTATPAEGAPAPAEGEAEAALDAPGPAEGAPVPVAPEPEAGGGGTVSVKLLVGADGLVRDARVVARPESRADAEEAALSAVRAAVFEPATGDDGAVEAWIVLDIPVSAIEAFLSPER